MKRYILGKPINIIILIAILAPNVVWAQANERLRARELGIQVGVFPTGVHNAITDVSGVQVGHSTVVQAPNVRTGVTAILPHAENAYISRVPAALHVGNG
ncbi:MAG TPA: aminopeptidase, partial [Gemmatimonadetes bacterium]|nr:aminopeptidase [Gemmatimonadota bacterium]